jgi:hypothetical protein
MWRVPLALPDLRSVPLVALDSEEKDDRLREGLGSGWPFRKGYICGISIAWRDESGIASRYFPVRHPDSANFDSEQIYQWVRDHISAGVRFVTQNGLYDWGWLRIEAGIRMPPAEQIEEIGALATMVDENRFKYSLDSLCAWRGLPGKDDTLLREGIEALGLIGNKRKKLVPQSHIWQLPAHYVGPYAEADAVNTLRLFENLSPILDQEGTRAAYRLECDILPMVQAMRLRGIRVDLDAAARARDLVLGKRDAVLAELSKELGCAIGMHLPGEGDPLFFEDRYEKPAKDGKKVKECRFRHVENGVELTDTGPRRILYGLQQLLKAGLSTPVFITEGAAKCDPLIAAGLAAVAAPYHTFKDECATALAGRNLIYLEDHDLPDTNGRIAAKEFSGRAQRQLSGLAASFQIVPALVLWKDLGRTGEPPHGWDVKDWIAEGGRAARLQEICKIDSQHGKARDFEVCRGTYSVRSSRT